MHEQRTANMHKCQCMKFSCIISGCPAGARKWHISYFTVLLHSKIPRKRPSGGEMYVGFQDRSILSLASSEPLARLNRASRSGTVSFFFSSPDTSMTIRPSYIMMSRLPWTMASFML